MWCRHLLIVVRLDVVQIEPTAWGLGQSIRIPLPSLQELHPSVSVRVSSRKWEFVSVTLLCVVTVTNKISLLTLHIYFKIINIRKEIIFQHCLNFYVPDSLYPKSINSEEVGMFCFRFCKLYALMACCINCYWRRRKNRIYLYLFENQAKLEYFSSFLYLLCNKRH